MHAQSIVQGTKVVMQSCINNRKAAQCINLHAHMKIKTQN